MSIPTLAAMLGTTTHLSPLLMKARRLGLPDAAALESLAVARGCSHYRHPDLASIPDVPPSQLSDAELAIALLSPCLPYSSHTIRVGAAMLGSLENTPDVVARLAVMERCVAAVRYIADAGQRYEPQNPFWTELLSLLPGGAPAKQGVFPDPTRFVAMTGFTRNGPETVVEWQRPRRRECVAA
jgi:hypothetical protein